MARTIIVSVLETPDGPPAELGRAWLGNDGKALVRGFWDVVRKRYEDVGIYHPDGPVPMSDGARFLDVLAAEYGRGSRMHVTEVDE